MAQERKTIYVRIPTMLHAQFMLLVSSREANPRQLTINDYVQQMIEDEVESRLPDPLEGNLPHGQKDPV